MVVGNFFTERIDITDKENLLEHDLGYLKNLRTDSQDNLYAIDTHLNQVVSFDSSGKFRFQFIETGQGPGEMIKPFHMQIYDDTLWISDLNQQKICLFNTEGEYLSEIKIQNGSTFSFAKENDHIYSSSKVIDKILIIQSLKSNTEKFALSNDILKQGRDLYETRELLFGFIPNLNKLVLFQSLLGTITVVDPLGFNIILQYDILNNGLVGFGKGYLDKRQKIKVMGKDGPVKPYNTYFSETFINDQELWAALFIQEKDLCLLGIKLNIKDQIVITPIVCNYKFSYTPSIAPFNQSNSIFIYNEKYNHLEKWLTKTEQIDNFL
jgi:hypothetical protein